MQEREGKLPKIKKMQEDTRFYQNIVKYALHFTQDPVFLHDHWS